MSPKNERQEDSPESSSRKEQEDALLLEQEDVEDSDSDSDIDNEQRKQHLIVIRHGDRWDYENPEAWRRNPHARDGDPPLSTLGHEQARDVGRYLASLFRRCGITSANDITWISSPFLRTIQTSNEALNSLSSVVERSQHIPILPEEGVSEWDGPGRGWHASLPSIEERRHYFPRLFSEAAIQYKSLHDVPISPEPLSQFLQRCKSTMVALNERHMYKRKTALVIVSHAAACIGLAAAATNQTLADITPAAPCSIYHMVRWENKPEWHLDAHDAPDSMNGYTKHLSSLGYHTVPWNNFGDKSIHAGYTGPPTSRFAPESLKKEMQQQQTESQDLTLTCEAQ